MKISEITNYLDWCFHPEYQEAYDNSGFLVGDPELECRGVLVAVDLTDEVIEEALESGVNLIVTHHPFLFTGVKRITPADAVGRMLMQLVKNDLSVYAAHTNLDNLHDGVNGILAEKLGLTECQILRPLAGKEEDNVGAGMIGTLARPVDTATYLERVKETLGLPMLRLSDIANKRVQRVAICGGAGSFLIPDAIAAGAEIYLTGDMKYHDFQRAEGRITLVDIGHYESEQYTRELIKSVISKKFSNFACLISRKGRSHVNYM